MSATMTETALGEALHHLLSILRFLADDGGRVTATRAQLLYATGWGNGSTLLRHVRNLEDAEVLEVEVAPGYPNTYVLKGVAA